jgi:hypothetical protein
MKISFQELNPLDWDDRVPDTEIERWVKHFSLMEEVRKVFIPRSIIPSEKDGRTKARLICLADAA